MTREQAKKLAEENRKTYLKDIYDEIQKAAIKGEFSTTVDDCTDHDRVMLENNKFTVKFIDRRSGGGYYRIYWD